MAAPVFVIDNQVLWLKTPKRGSPPNWIPGHNYKLGDTVVPSVGVTIPSGEEGNMFQCVGFIGKTGTSAPAFPNVLGNKVVDNNVEWTARNPAADPIQPTNEEYYYITRNITVSSS
jgi:hypothetical protein